MEITSHFQLESSLVSSDAELDWCTSRGRQDGESARDSATVVGFQLDGKVSDAITFKKNVK